MKIPDLLKNETVQTIILTIVIALAFTLGLPMAFKSQYPILAVASTSMTPTLNVGDYVIVLGVNADEIKTENIFGDIIVFPNPSDPGELIVHRAVGRDHGGRFITKGDNNPTNDGWRILGNNIIGKVIARIPYLGNLSLFTHTQQGTYMVMIILFFLILLILIEPIFSSKKEEKDNASQVEKSIKKRKPIERILEGEVIFLVVLNVLLVSLVIFSLWSSFTFWQPGADPPQPVTIRGMYSDLEFHEGFKKSHNNVTEAFLSQGFIIYKIDCSVNEGMRPGVPTFSWVQFSIVALLIIDAWALINFVRVRRKMQKDERSASVKSSGLQF